MARILIVDDESNVRMMLRLALIRDGHDVQLASDGFEGLEHFGDGAGWDLVLLDQRMPGIDGLEVLRTMRARAPAARIIMITAFGTFDLAEAALRAGATEFLRKPFTVETLRASVRAALAGEAGGEFAGNPTPTAFDVAHINGFRIASLPGVTHIRTGDISDQFTVRDAAGTERTCRVVLPAYVVELVKAHADRETLPGGDAFWQALCGEVLANYLWQNAAPPDGDVLQIDDLTSGLRHWLDAVLAQEEKPGRLREPMGPDARWTS